MFLRYSVEESDSFKTSTPSRIDHKINKYIISAEISSSDVGRNIV